MQDCHFMCNQEEEKLKKIIPFIMTAVMIITLLPAEAAACVSETEDAYAYVLDQDETWGASTGLDGFNGDVYIPEGTRLTVRDDVTINGDVYVYGTLENKGELEIDGTLHCLRYVTVADGSTFDSDYDPGSVITLEEINCDSVDTGGSFLSRQIPASHGHRFITDVEKASRSYSGRITEICELCGYIKSTKTVSKVSRISLSKSSFTWTGSRKTPSVTVKDSKGRTLKKNTDYKVTYSNNKNVGKASVKVTLRGNYTGSSTMKFKILPKGTKLSSLKAGTKSFTARWKKQPKQTSGYQLRYSTTRSGSGKTKLISGSSSISKTVKGLSGGKKYYVRVRTYKTVNGVRYFSGWSSVKAVTAKKAVKKPSSGGHSGTVYITETGARYHYNYNCRGLANARRKIPTTLAKAKAQGYTLCGYERYN